MRKLFLIALGMIALYGCAGEHNEHELNDQTSANQSGSKQWKEFVAPLSVKTQSPGDRMLKRTENKK